MQESVFKKELSRYRVVRRDDHHKIRWRKVSKEPTSTTDTSANSKPKRQVQPVSTADINSPFFKHLKEITAGILTQDEQRKFLLQFQEVTYIILNVVIYYNFIVYRYDF